MRKFSVLLFLLLSVAFVRAQKYTISGYVQDAQSGEMLIAASVFDVDNVRYGTMTNEYGYFSLTLPVPKVHLRVSYVGYHPLDTVVTIGGQQVVFKLHSSTAIQQVVVTGYKQELKSSQMGRISVPVKMIQNLPVIFGEGDLMKTLQLLPGVESGTEGSGGVYVRGGGPDQNLILLDGVPVYNLNHLFGFFSVFTPEAIKDVTLLKGGFPAHYGGRLSSVIDIRMKDGNMDHLTGSVSIGLISSKFTVEGPIKKNKTSFIISARRTYYDLLAKPFLIKFGHTRETDDTSYTQKSDMGAGYYFYDLYAKVNHKFSRKDRIYLSFYSGLDKAYISTGSEFNYFGKEREKFDEQTKSSGDLHWGNTIAAFRWNHAFGKKIFSNLTLTYSNFMFSNMFDTKNSYHQDTISQKEHYSLGYNLGIRDLAMSYDFDYSPNANNYIKFGVNGIYHHFQPGYVSMTVDADYMHLDTTFGSIDIYAPELAAYVEDDFKIGELLRINAGMRFSTFVVRKKVFLSPEPRISARVMISDNISFKASYAKMKQYLHFLTNNTLGLPIDVWVPATDRVVPEDSWQVSASLTWLTPKGINVTLESFYKKMNNLVELKEGQSVFSSVLNGSNTWEDNVTQGQGWSYGAELLIKKDFGRLTGWIGYTLAWSMRRFPEINFGQVFPYKYDRRHDISIVGTYKLRKNIIAGFTWVYGSGLPVTLARDEFLSPSNPVSVEYWYGGPQTRFNTITYYGGRNSYRLPSYNRLDLSMNFYKQRKKGTREWTIGVYNAYNHVNPFFAQLYDKYDEQTGKNNTTLRVYSIFPIMPFISYKFTWK